ncbi:pyrroline-5-carboxylate reductase [Sphingobacteriales bacterium UPWRP_1]|nr:pyrroline-5-carboxylate reductase [Sphingobacteriales bacterium TSM_CSM]PSJ73087.1 pyrroline-5-carboxylate reductase [Sphingobacteriales bacterium UPWRP_1]
MKVLIIGGGNMGNTFAESFLSAHIIRPKDLLILETNPQRAEYLRERNRGTIYQTPGNYINEADLVVLAVKPQDAETVYPVLRPYLTPNTLVLSIMAGVRLESIEKGLGISKIIRSMPNLPAQVGMGMTAFTAKEEVSRKELIEVQNLLSTTGRAIYFDDERMIDAATAISGSGPAYVYYFMKYMIEAAMQLGFSESQAELLVWQTFVGAMQLHNKSALSCDEWIKRVASKGGTTEAALHVFEGSHLGDAIQNGVIAAFKRAEELGS